MRVIYALLFFIVLVSLVALHARIQDTLGSLTRLHAVETVLSNR